MEERYTIKSDQEAEWAIEKIAEERATTERLKELANLKIQELRARIKEIEEREESSTAFLTSALSEYFQTVKKRKTKTTEKYDLLSGTLTLKHKKPKTEYKDEDLLAWAKENAQEYIETKESLKWGELKKTLDLDGEIAIVKDTGEMIDCIQLVPQASEFIVEVKK